MSQPLSEDAYAEIANVLVDAAERLAESDDLAKVRAKSAKAAAS